jgi:hypothetical protein
LTVVKDPLFVEETRQDLDDLAALKGSSDEEAKADANIFCNHVQAMFTELVQGEAVLGV